MKYARLQRTSTHTVLRCAPSDITLRTRRQSTCPDRAVRTAEMQNPWSCSVFAKVDDARVAGSADNVQRQLLTKYLSQTLPPLAHSGVIGCHSRTQLISPFVVKRPTKSFIHCYPLASPAPYPGAIASFGLSGSLGSGDINSRAIPMTPRMVCRCAFKEWGRQGGATAYM
eukprot:2922796-Prymnesium_polylepis.1